MVFVCVHVFQIDTNKLFPLLKRGGTFVAIALTPATHHFAVGPVSEYQVWQLLFSLVYYCAHVQVKLSVPWLVRNSITFAGSNVAASQEFDELLEFCAMHNIRPQVEVMPFDQISEAIQRVKAGLGHYRVVCVRGAAEPKESTPEHQASR